MNRCVAWRRDLRLPSLRHRSEVTRDPRGVKKYDLDVTTCLFLGLLLLFFGLFLFYPVGLLLKGAFMVEGRFSLRFFELLLSSPLKRESLWNSFSIALLTTVLTTLLTLPLAWAMTRFNFAGKALLGSLLLVPMIMPPFVGAIGLRQLLSRFGSLNLFLMDLGLLPPDQPIDWLGAGGFWGIVLLQVLNLYPIMFLNVSAAMANIDPALREAAQNLGAKGWRLFRTVTLPLILPGYFAGSIIVFIRAFTDLGIPLIPMGYTLVVFVLVLTVALFVISKQLLARKRHEMIARGHTLGAEAQATTRQAAFIWLAAGGLIAVALLPHVMALFPGRFNRHSTFGPDRPKFPGCRTRISSISICIPSTACSTRSAASTSSWTRRTN
jgi:iron(III) transport system permease protein